MYWLTQRSWHATDLTVDINVYYTDWRNDLDTLRIWQWTLMFIILIDATILTRYEFDSGHQCLLYWLTQRSWHAMKLTVDISVYYTDWRNNLDMLRIWQWTSVFIILLTQRSWHATNLTVDINVHYIDWHSDLGTLRIWQWTLMFIILIDTVSLTCYEYDSGH